MVNRAGLEPATRWMSRSWAEHPASLRRHHRVVPQIRNNGNAIPSLLLRVCFREKTTVFSAAPREPRSVVSN